jgi:hypothetical protein
MGVDEVVTAASEDVDDELPPAKLTALTMVLADVELCIVVVIEAVVLDDLKVVLAVDSIELELVTVDGKRVVVVVGDEDEDGDVDSAAVLSVDAIELELVAVDDTRVVVVVGDEDGDVDSTAVVFDVDVVSVVLLLAVVVSVDTHLSVSGMVQLNVLFIGAQVTLNEPLFPDCHMKPV